MWLVVSFTILLFYYSAYPLRAVSKATQELIIYSVFRGMCLLADVQTVSIPPQLTLS